MRESKNLLIVISLVLLILGVVLIDVLNVLVLHYKLRYELPIENASHELTKYLTPKKRSFYIFMHSTKELNEYFNVPITYELKSGHKFIVSVGAPLSKTVYVFNRLTGSTNPRQTEYYYTDPVLSKNYTGKIYIYTFNYDGIEYDPTWGYPERDDVTP